MTTAPAPESTRGQGFYSLGELSAYVALMSGDRKDYYRAPDWLAYPLNKVEHERWQPDYSFADLISLFVVRFLIRAGVKPRFINEAESHLRETLGTDRPFLSADLKTDGTHVYWRDDVVDGQIEAASLRGQQAMRRMVSERLVSVKYSKGWASSWSPEEYIVLNPRIQFGEPTIAGTRLLAETVAEAVQHLGSVKAASQRLSVEPEAVSSAVKFKRRLAAVSAH